MTVDDITLRQGGQEPRQFSRESHRSGTGDLCRQKRDVYLRTISFNKTVVQTSHKTILLQRLCFPRQSPNDRGQPAPASGQPIGKVENTQSEAILAGQFWPASKTL